MKYLVLRSFRTFGQYLERGTIVDESAIRSPRLRMVEGKITPAVSSSNIPAVPDRVPALQGNKEEGKHIEQEAIKQTVDEALAGIVDEKEAPVVSEVVEEAPPEEPKKPKRKSPQLKLNK